MNLDNNARMLMRSVRMYVELDYIHDSCDGGGKVVKPQVLCAAY